MLKRNSHIGGYLLVWRYQSKPSNDVNKKLGKYNKNEVMREREREMAYK